MFCDFQTSIELEEISFSSSFQFWTNTCFANKLLKLWWMKKEKNRKQEIINFSFFNRNYPSLFCYASFAFRYKIIYREKHTMTKCLKRSLNALPELFSQKFPNPLPQTPKKPPNIRRCLIEIFMLIIHSKLKSKHYYYSLYL